MNRWIRFGNAIERVVNFLAALLAAMMTLVVCWQVFARYVLNTGQFWAEEFAIICMFWLVCSELPAPSGPGTTSA